MRRQPSWRVAVAVQICGVSCSTFFRPCPNYPCDLCWFSEWPASLTLAGPVLKRKESVQKFVQEDNISVFPKHLNVLSHALSVLRSCPPFLTVRERGEGRRPQPLTAVLRSCRTSYRGLQRGGRAGQATSYAKACLSSPEDLSLAPRVRKK